MAVKSDIEIAREAVMKPIAEVGGKLGIPADQLLHYGPHKAQSSLIGYEPISKPTDYRDFHGLCRGAGVCRDGS